MQEKGISNTSFSFDPINLNFLIVRKEREGKEADALKPVVKATEDEESKAVKRSFNDDEFKIVNNKIPKRDYTEEREEFKGFGKKKDTREKYDPLKLFKSKLAGDENPEPVEEIPNTENMGKIENGIVMFENEEAGNEKLLAVNKVYHSSSEDEDEVKKQAEKKLKKKKAKEDIKSAEFKEKMTKRFLEKQRATQESVSNADVKRKEVKKNQGKYYEDTSDEEETPEDSGKTGSDVLKTFQSFSNFWQDSDNEDETPVKEVLAEKSEDDTESDDEKSDDEKSDDKKSDDVESDSDDSESEESEEEDEKDEESEIQEKEAPRLVSDVSMPRYDPTSEDHEQFLRSNDNKKEDDTEEASDKPKNFFEVKTDLKKVFDSKSNKSSGFSFGFSKEGQTEDTESKKGFSFGFESTKTEEASMDVDSDGEDMLIPKKKNDIGAKFGLQLKGKGVPKSENTFFFGEEDPRLEEGLSFFFDSKIDLNQLREKYNERRPILSDILKKRARNKAKRNEGSKNAFGKKKSTSWQKGSKRKQFNK